MKDLFEAAGSLKRSGQAEIRRLVRSARGVLDTSLRCEVVLRRGASAENGTPRRTSEHESAAVGLSVTVGGRAQAIGYGYSGVELGYAALTPARFLAAIRTGFKDAYERAHFNAGQCAQLIREYGAGAVEWIPADPVQVEIPASCTRDPRSVATSEVARLALDSSRELTQLGDELRYNVVSAFTEMRQEIFLNGAGTFISQNFAVTQGDCYVVAQSGEGHQECHDTIGQQRGLECLTDGWHEGPTAHQDLRSFALEMGREARTLAAAPALKTTSREVVIVTDPHFNALMCHEIVGHPSEADRALKMEAGYAGRSWFLRSLADNEIGHRIGSPILSACSDPGAAWLWPL